MHGAGGWWGLLAHVLLGALGPGSGPGSPLKNPPAGSAHLPAHTSPCPPWKLRPNTNCNCAQVGTATARGHCRRACGLCAPSKMPEGTGGAEAACARVVCSNEVQRGAHLGAQFQIRLALTFHLAPSCQPGHLAEAIARQLSTELVAASHALLTSAKNLA